MYIHNIKVREMVRKLLPSDFKSGKDSRSLEVTASKFKLHKYKPSWYANKIHDHYQLKVDLFLPSQEAAIDLNLLEQILSTLPAASKGGINSDQLNAFQKVREAIEYNKENS